MGAHTTTTFSSRLRHELDSRGWGLRTLARVMATRANEPDRVESLRRQLRKYLDGTQPTPRVRHAIEGAFDLEQDAMKDEDEDRVHTVAIPVQVTLDLDLLAQAIERRGLQLQAVAP